MTHDEEVLDFAEQAIALADGLREAKWKIRRLREIRDWAYAQQPVKVGDRVALTKQPNTDNGWHSYREALHPGAVGVITSVEFYGDRWAAGFQPDEFYGDRWAAGFQPDELWIRTSFDGKRLDTRPGIFHMSMSFFRALGADEENEPWVLEP